jgi:phage terminase Nu1 subunit (DNA packaging protein)
VDVLQGSKNYVDSGAVSKLFGVTARRVQQLVQENIITAIKVKGNYKYDLPLVVQQYIKHLSDKAAGREGKGTMVEQEREKLDADIRMKKARAAMLELQYAELEGKMLRAEDVQAVTTDHVYTFRGMLVALPGRLAVDMVGVGTAAEASNLIRAEVYKIMEELSAYRYDPEVYAKRVRDRQGWSELMGDEANEL